MVRTSRADIRLPPSEYDSRGSTICNGLDLAHVTPSSPSGSAESDVRSLKVEGWLISAAMLPTTTSGTSPRRKRTRRRWLREALIPLLRDKDRRPDQYRPL